VLPPETPDGSGSVGASDSRSTGLQVDFPAFLSYNVSGQVV